MVEMFSKLIKDHFIHGLLSLLYFFDKMIELADICFLGWMLMLAEEL